MTVIVHGPKACGKTRNAEMLARKYGCHSIVDDWLNGHRIVPGALHLTYENVRPRPNVLVVAFRSLGLNPATGSNIRTVPRIQSRRLYAGEPVVPPQSNGRIATALVDEMPF